VAGIGFELRETLGRRTFTAYWKAYATALAYASGPWICTILSLASIVVVARRFLPITLVEQFTVTTVYVYAFSLILAGPIQLVTTRFVADRIYDDRPEAIGAAIVTALGLVTLLGSLVGALFVGASSLPPALKVSAVLLYVVVCCLWVVMSYITCLKNYRLVLWSFVLGMAAATFGALGMAHYSPFPLLGLILGFGAGHVLVLIILVVGSMAELEGTIEISWEYLGYFRRHPLLLVAGLLTSLAIWTDKFVIWAFYGEAVWNVFLFYPRYDIPAYLAYLTALPSTAFFLIKIETVFAERYERFIASLLDDPASIIAMRKEAMSCALRDGVAQLASFQGVITLAFLLVAPGVLGLLRIDDCPPFLFRTLLVAAYCHFTFLHLIIFLTYLDRQRHLVGLLTLFVGSSAVLTTLVARYGNVEYLGLGYACAAAMSAVAAWVVLLRKVDDADSDILFAQPLLDARGKIIKFMNCSEDTYGGRELLRRTDASSLRAERSSS